MATRRHIFKRKPYLFDEGSAVLSFAFLFEDELGAGAALFVDASGARCGVERLPFCNALRPMRQVSSSYSLLLPCLFLRVAYCNVIIRIASACLQNLHPSDFPRFLPLSVLSPDTLACARGTSEIFFYKWPENVLGMG